MNGLTYGTTSVQYTSKATCWSAKWLTVPLHGAFRHGTLTGTLLQSSIVTLTAQEHSRAVFWKLRTCRACGEPNMLCTRTSLLPLNSWAVSDYSNSCSTVVCVFAFFFFFSTLDGKLYVKELITWVLCNVIACAKIPPAVLCSLLIEAPVNQVQSMPGEIQAAKGSQLIQLNPFIKGILRAAILVLYTRCVL